ncbi:MAG: hypothetical protein JRJ77_17820, partial [Deltaproteobacteria bacterium]|nr:hypothetical protein [Deltaproteobacteria bacterium]
MKKISTICAVVTLMISVIAIGIAAADGPIPITADQAFNMKAADPDHTVIVDIRTTAEYHWVGTCAKVTEIQTTNGTITPDNGKVKLVLGGRLLTFRVSGRARFLPV